MKSLELITSAIILCSFVPTGGTAAGGGGKGPAPAWKPLLTRTFAGDVALGAEFTLERPFTGDDALSLRALARGAEIVEASWIHGPRRGRTGALIASGARFSRFRYPYPDVTGFAGSDRIKSLEYRVSAGVSLPGGVTLLLSSGIDRFFHDTPFLAGGSDEVAPSAPGGTFSVVEVSASIDRLDRRFYPTSGFIVSASRREWGIFGTDPQIATRLHLLSGSAFLEIPAAILSLHLSSVTSSESSPLYMRSHLGGERTVRGRDFGTIHGDNSLLCRSELSIPLNFDDISELGNPVILVDLSLFADAGAAWDHGEYLSRQEFFGGFGLCLDFIPHREFMMKIGAAWNSASSGSFYFDIGTDH